MIEPCRAMADSLEVCVLEKTVEPLKLPTLLPKQNNLN